MVDTGSGTPIVLIPGLQGRWEWMRTAVDALARHHRVITFSLCDERRSLFPCDPGKAFENYVSQVELAMRRARIERAVIAGVSYGGLIAAEFAARNPDRISGLVLASALHASWKPNENQRRFLNAPMLNVPFFIAGAAGRVRVELAAAMPGLSERLRFTVVQGARVVMAPTSPMRMARRIAWSNAHRFTDLRHVTAPALLVTGEPGLDHVVPVEVTRRYLDDFAGAEHVVIKRTGHNGLVTRPDAFAGVLERFVNDVRVCA